MERALPGHPRAGGCMPRTEGDHMGNPVKQSQVPAEAALILPVETQYLASPSPGPVAQLPTTEPCPAEPAPGPCETKPTTGRRPLDCGMRNGKEHW